MSKKKASGQKSGQGYNPECTDCMAVDGFIHAMDVIFDLKNEAKKNGSVKLKELDSGLELLFNVIMVLSEVSNENVKEGIEEVKSQLWPKQKPKAAKKKQLEIVKS